MVDDTTTVSVVPENTLPEPQVVVLGPEYTPIDSIPEFSQDLTRDEVYEILALIGNIYTSKGLIGQQTIYLKTQGGSNWTQFTSEPRSGKRYNSDEESRLLRYSTLFSLFGALGFWLKNHGYPKLAEFNDPTSWKHQMMLEGQVENDAISERSLSRSEQLHETALRLYQAAVRIENNDVSTPTTTSTQLFPKTELVQAYSDYIDLPEDNTASTAVVAGEEGGEADGDLDEVSEGVLQAAVPQIQGRPQAQVPNQDAQAQVPHMRKRRSDEFSWIYSAALGDLFYSRGVSSDQIPPELRALLVGEIALLMRQQSDASLLLMFADDEKRKALLTKLYGRLQSSQFFSKLSAFYTQKLNETKDPVERKELEEKIRKDSTIISGGIVTITNVESTNPEDILEMSIEEILHSDNPAVIRNIQRTIETLVLAYGVISVIPDDAERQRRQEENPMDALWFIHSLSKGKIALIFQIEQDLSAHELAKLKDRLSNYAISTAANYVLQARSIGVAYGTFAITKSEKQALEAGGSEGEKVFSNQVRIINDVRQLIAEAGGDTVAIALNKKLSKESLKTEYKIFLPLWNSLSPEEQRFVYRNFNIQFSKNVDSNASLPFINEFLMFRLKDLERFKSLSKTEQEALIAGKASPREISAKAISTLEKELEETHKLAFTPPVGTLRALERLAALERDIQRMGENIPANSPELQRLKQSIALARVHLERQRSANSRFLDVDRTTYPEISALKSRLDSFGEARPGVSTEIRQIKSRVESVDREVSRLGSSPSIAIEIQAIEAQNDAVLTLSQLRIKLSEQIRRTPSNEQLRDIDAAINRIEQQIASEQLAVKRAEIGGESTPSASSTSGVASTSGAASTLFEQSTSIKALKELKDQLQVLVRFRGEDRAVVKEIQNEIAAVHERLAYISKIQQAKFSDLERNSLIALEKIHSDLNALGRQQPRIGSTIKEIHLHVGNIEREVFELEKSPSSPIAAQSDAILSLGQLRTQLYEAIKQSPSNSQLRAIETAIQKIEQQINREQQAVRRIEAKNDNPNTIFTVVSSEAASLFEKSESIKALERLKDQLRILSNTQSQDRMMVIEIQEKIAAVHKRLAENKPTTAGMPELSVLTEEQVAQYILFEKMVELHERNRQAAIISDDIKTMLIAGRSQDEIAAIMSYLYELEMGGMDYDPETDEGFGGGGGIDEFSPAEISQADQAIHGGKLSRGSIAQRLRNWRSRGSEPKTKLQKGFSHASNKLMSRGAQALSPWAAGALTLSNKLLGEENTNKIIGGSAALLAGSTLAILSSWGGRIGALLGGAIGGLAGSYIPIVGTVLGALGGGLAGGVAGHFYLQPALDKIFGTGATQSGAGFSGANLGNLNLSSSSVAGRISMGSGTGAGASVSTGAGTSSATSTGGFGANASTTSLGAQTLGTTPGAAGAGAGIGGAGTSAGLTTTQSNLWQTLAKTLSELAVDTTAPIGAMAFGMTSFAFTMWVIFAAFLAPLPLEPGSGSQIPGFLEGFEGCWPTTGTITGYLTYSDTGDPHATMTGSLSGFSGPGTAIDISTGSNQPPIYSPFNGTADFYPNGHGIHPNYGTHVVLTTPDFAIIFAHMRDFGAAATMNEPTLGVPIVAGQQIGNVNSTGNSTGNHLHYEVVGTSILNLLPLSLEFKQAVALDEETIFGLPVSSTDCAIKNLGDPTGFMAIGPKEVSNLLMSSTAEINQGPIRTCSWRQNRNLAVAINANFFNDDGLPSGIAGNNFAKYWGNADNRDITFIEQMQSLVVTSSTDTITMVRPDPDLAYSPEGDFPIDLPQYNSGITGLYVDGDSSTSTLDSRTLVATGTASAECSTEYAGQEVIFFLVMNGVSFDTIEQEARRCGATQFIHLDGGGSSAFCSNDANLNFATTRNVPVSVGMYRAELFSIFDDENGGTVLEGDSGGSVGDPTPPVAPF